MKKHVLFLGMIAIVACGVLHASDKSDAESLMKKCDQNVKVLEIPVRNFGDPDDLEKFDAAVKAIKLGKVKLAQSKFLDAKAKFAEYLATETEIYKSLSAKYIERTNTIIDTIAEDLADFMDDDLLKRFSMASQYLETAKEESGKKRYVNSIQPCRLAKQQVIGIYPLVKKDIPPDYAIDRADNENKLFDRGSAKE